MRYHFYHRDTGILHTNTYANNLEDKARALQCAQANAPPDHVPIYGDFDCENTRINPVTLKTEPYQSEPPSDEHVWNEDMRKWVVAPLHQRSRAAQHQIQQLEIAQARQVRELVLQLAHAAGLDVSRLAALDDQINTLRKDVQDALHAKSVSL